VGFSQGSSLHSEIILLKDSKNEARPPVQRKDFKSNVVATMLWGHN
jgi:hypothetical protein